MKMRKKIINVFQDKSGYGNGKLVTTEYADSDFDFEVQPILEEVIVIKG